MNKPELEAILKKARLPEIPGESLEIFPRRIVARLKHNDYPGHAPRKFSWQIAWAFGLGAFVVIACAIGLRNGKTGVEANSVNDSVANIKLIRETTAMFPNQVRAIIQDEHGLSLVLSDSEDVPASAPLYVRICDGKHCSSCVTFSGQEIQVAGQKIMVLADSRGGIIVAGDKFVWTNSERAYAGNHLKIEAKPL